MPKAIYEDIYRSLKRRIEEGVYPKQSLMPSEHELISEYDCSRNTVRRALAMLGSDGYVQSVHGKGVYVIYSPVEQAAFTIGVIESFRESAERNHLKVVTKVVSFSELAVDEKIASKTGFPVGEMIYYIQRVRYLDGRALILDTNLFLQSVVGNLTEEIASQSIYAYLENERHVTIVTSKRRMTVEPVREIDEKYLSLNLKDYNCMAVVTSWTYDANGTMFEYTESRHCPDHFSFQDTAVRR